MASQRNTTTSLQKVLRVLFYVCVYFVFLPSCLLCLGNVLHKVSGLKAMIILGGGERRKTTRYFFTVALCIQENIWKKSYLVSVYSSQKFVFLKLCMISVLSYLYLQLELPSSLKFIFLISVCDETYCGILLQFLYMKNHLKI